MTLECPNCVTPWKCNGPHILSNNLDGVHYYSCEEGIFMKEFDGWNFIPNEKSFTSNQLLDIINTLNILNENKDANEEN